MSQKPSIPKGTRDFSPIEMKRRNYIFTTIRQVFELHGFQPIETPAMENLSTLLGKYGDEGDKLLFRILNSGDFLSDVVETDPRTIERTKLSSLICEKGLRYDLTVPFARYVVQHQNELTFPFKRYQIQPVWRADRPQKGRYREFFQCDADVVGSDSLLNEVELIQIIDEVFSNLGIPVTIKLNNRKILAAIAEHIGREDLLVDITVAIDKLDKVGVDKVNEELLAKGLTEDKLNLLQPLFSFSGTNESRLKLLEELVGSYSIGKAGIEELRFLVNSCPALSLQNPLELDITLARGLNYYTGAIFEVKARDVQIGSISGGGRYDDLTGIFGLKGVSGVGISFGADRIYDVLDQMQGFPADTLTATEVLFVNFGNNEALHCMSLAEKFRRAGISCEVFPETAKMKKQMGYADAKGIPFVALLGENEIKAEQVTLKEMASGKQISLPAAEALTHILNTRKK